MFTNFNNPQFSLSNSEQSPAVNLIATPYNGLLITAITALTNQHFVQVDLNGILYDQLVINTKITHGATAPGNGRTITLKGRFSDESISSGNVSELSTTFSDFYFLWNRENTGNITRRFIHSLPTYSRYLIFTIDHSASDSGSNMTVNVKIRGRWSIAPWGN